MKYLAEDNENLSKIGRRRVKYRVLLKVSAPSVKTGFHNELRGTAWSLARAVARRVSIHNKLLLVNIL